jgi:hypothetical protein
MRLSDLITNRMIRDFFVDKGELIGSLGGEGSEEMIVKREDIGRVEELGDLILENKPKKMAIEGPTEDPDL